MNAHGIQTVGHAHGRDEGDLALLQALHELQLVRHDVDGIDDEIIGCIKDEVFILRHVPQFQGTYLHFGQDGLQVLFHGQCLIYAQSVHSTLHVTVAVGDMQCVKVDQGQLTDAHAGQRFRSVGTDAADADDQH